jgi:predicted nucleotidyltransferase
MIETIPKNIEILLKDVKNKLYDFYKERLKKLILIGSYARGDFEEGSDIDLLLVLDKVSDYNEERVHYFSFIYEIGFRNDIVISIIPVSMEIYNKHKTPLLLNAIREGVSL